MLWRSIIWVVCTVFITPVPQQVPLECEITTISPPNNPDTVIFSSMRALPNGEILYLTGKDGAEKLWLANTHDEVQYVADVAVYYSMVPEFSVYRDEKFIYLSDKKDADILSLEQIDLQTYAHDVLFEEVYFSSMYLRGDWLFIPLNQNTLVARNLITEEEITLFFENAGGPGIVKPVGKVTETHWLFYKDNHIFGADLATGGIQELAIDTIAVFSSSYSAPVHDIFDDTLVFIRRSDHQLVQITLDGTIQQEIPLQGAGNYRYLEATAQGVVYTFDAADEEGSHAYFVNLVNQGEIIHLNDTTASVSRTRLVNPLDESSSSALWYQTDNDDLYRVELTPPFTPELIREESGDGSMYYENQHIIYHTDQGYVTFSNDRTHVQNMGDYWGYGVSADDKVYFRGNEAGDIFQYDYVTHTVEELGTIQGEEIRLFPVPGQDFLYFQSDDNFGIMSFNGAISVEDGHLRYLNEYPVGQDPHWGGLRQLSNGALIFASNDYRNLTYVQCHE